MPDSLTTAVTDPAAAASDADPDLAVFVSYASGDRERALAVARTLEDAGIRAWVDTEDITAGYSYGPEIVAGIRNSSALVLLWSAASLISRNIRQELQLAWRFGRPILPLRLEPVDLPDTLAYWLEGAQWIDVFDHPPTRWLPRVRQALGRLGAALSGMGALAPATLPPAPTSKLPVPPTPLLGRERELADIKRHLADGVRLVTLTGPGGSGKTRLALAAAHAVAGEFAQGAVFVNLAPVTDPTMVLPAIAEAIGLHEAGEQPLAEQLHTFLRAQHLLLVLDNVEQVLAAAAGIADVLAAAPKLVIIATSRAPLELRAEQKVAVGPLPLPPTGEVVGSIRSPAVALFLDRAGAAGTEVPLTDASIGTIAEIVRRLDGLPLAIELAAARTKLFPPEALLKRLERRLPLLTGGVADLPARQRTLRGTIAWSHALLSPDERTLFQRLAVFTGGCSFEAIEALAAPAGEIDMYEGLAALVRQSLLRQERTEGEPRFTMLETIREFATEQLDASGEAAALRRGHAEYFLALAERAEPAVHGVPDPVWIHQLETEHGNLRAALTWAITDDVSMALRLGGALGWFWQVRGYLSEGRVMLGRALAATDGTEPALQAKALWTAGDLAEYQYDFGAATAALEQALTLWRALGDRRNIARALLSLGHVEADQRNYEPARERYTESIALWRAVGDERGMAIGTAGLAAVAFYQGDYERAAQLWTDSADLFRTLGDKRRLGILLTNLGCVAWAHGDLDRAVRLHEESLALVRELGDQPGIATSLTNLGIALQGQGNRERARHLLEEALQRYRELGILAGVGSPLYHLAWQARERGEAERAAAFAGEALASTRATHGWLWIGHPVELLAALAADQDQAERGARLLGATAALRDVDGETFGVPEQGFHDRVTAAVASRLSEDAASALMAAGRAMSRDQVLDEAAALAMELASGEGRESP